MNTPSLLTDEAIYKADFCLASNDKKNPMHSELCFQYKMDVCCAFLENN